MRMSLKTFCEIPIHLRTSRKSKQMLVWGASNPIQESVCHYNFNLEFQDGKTATQKFIVFKELNTWLILGMDFITNHALTFLPTQWEFRWGDPKDWYWGWHTKIGVFGVAPVTMHLKTATSCLAGPEQQVVAQVGHSKDPLITRGPYVV